MPKNREGWIPRIFCFSVFSIVLIFALDCQYLFLPIHGILLFLYIVFLISISIWLTSQLLRNVLKENKPIQLDLQNYPQLSFFLSFFVKIQKPPLSDLQASEDQSKLIDYVQIPCLVKGERKKSLVNKLILEERSIIEDEIDLIKSFPHLKEIKLSPVDARIKDFVTDIKKRFLISWYQHVSNDDHFLEESEKLLDEVVRRFLQVVVQVDHKKLTRGFLVILLRHIKEFRKTVIRAEKNGTTVEECYRYTHIGSKSDEVFEHFVFQLTTNVLRQFISSELWNSMLSKSLVAILSKKLTTHMLNYVSQPGFLNYRIVQICADENLRKELNLDTKAYISLSDIDLDKKTNEPSEKNLDSLKIKGLQCDSVDGSSTPKFSPKKIPEQNFDCAGSLKLGALSSIEEASNDNLAQCAELEDDEEGNVTTRPKSEPVKIYQSSSHKTWRNSSDLESISFGEDLLALQESVDPDSQIQNLIEKKLWKDTSDSVESEEKHHSIWNIHETLFGDDDSLELKEGVSPSTNMHSAAQIITNTMKPIGNVTANTIQNMKDLQQSTVNTVNSVVKPISQVTSNAKHKIGDLQDEAAGVMEGILDFGMAGIRKGLRLTGLQENISDLTQKSKQEIHKIQKTLDSKASDVMKSIETVGHKYETTKIEVKSESKLHKPPKLVKLSNITSDDIKLEERTSSNESNEDNFWVNPLNNKESPSFDGQILLEHTPNTPISLVKDVSKSLEKDGSIKLPEIPQIAMEAELDTTSPDLEYEDTTDLATTTAKLRSLLQQRSSESNLTTPALSPMPQDDSIKITTPLEAADLADVDGVMPSLYKFYNKTATGLQNTFNTIKTALPGTEKTPEAATVHGDSMDSWKFEYIEPSNNDFARRMERLLHERRDYCTVDPAYDYLELMDHTDGILSRSNSTYDDELDDFDLQIPLTLSLTDILCELLSDTKTPVVQEPIIKIALLLGGLKSEEYMNNASLRAIKNIKNVIGKLPHIQNDNPLAMDLDKMANICADKVPGLVYEVLGRNTVLAAIKLFIMSTQSQRINRDVMMQFFEVFAYHLIQANNVMSPDYSA